MAKKRILILGAGLAGLSAAWHLQKSGKACQIFEKEKTVGGLCRSKEINGFIFDCDGHLLHFKHNYTFNLIKRLLNGNLAEHKRSAWVYSHAKYIPYPFQANLYGLPANVIKDCVLGLIQMSKNGRSRYKHRLNFLDWIEETFGKGIAKHFMIPYNLKFWTVPPQSLTCEWLDRFIPVPSLSDVVKGTLAVNKTQFGYNSRFWYPKRGGMSQIPFALANSLKDIYTDSEVVKINLQKKEIITAEDRKERFDYLISTVPLPKLSRFINDQPSQIKLLFKKLRWNSVFNLNLGIAKKDDSRRHWIYFPQKDISFFRVGFFHNFSSNLAPQGHSSLYAEVAYSRDKPIDKNKIASRIKEDLRKVKLISKDDRIVSSDINDIKYGYPIYDKNYSLAREKILHFLRRNNIIPCGRYGSWRYMSMEDVILDAKNVAESL